MSAREHWSRAYLGIPWAAHGRDRSGCDCWGLVRLVYADRGVALPCLAGAYLDPLEHAEVAALLDAEAAADASPWREVDRAAARACDLIILDGPSARGWPHVGVAIDAGRMLHVAAGGQACLARLDTYPWRARALRVARHRDMPEAAP